MRNGMLVSRGLLCAYLLDGPGHINIGQWALSKGRCIFIDQLVLNGRGWQRWWWWWRRRRRRKAVDELEVTLLVHHARTRLQLHYFACLGRVANLQVCRSLLLILPPWSARLLTLLPIIVKRPRFCFQAKQRI